MGRMPARIELIGLGGLVAACQASAFRHFTSRKRPVQPMFASNTAAPASSRPSLLGRDLSTQVLTCMPSSCMSFKASDIWRSAAQGPSEPATLRLATQSPLCAALKLAPCDLTRSGEPFEAFQRLTRLGDLALSPHLKSLVHRTLAPLPLPFY